jgi:hypothetical protein
MLQAGRELRGYLHCLDPLELSIYLNVVRRMSSMVTGQLTRVMMAATVRPLPARSTAALAAASVLVKSARRNKHH